MTHMVGEAPPVIEIPETTAHIAVIAIRRCGGTALAAAIATSYARPLIFEPFHHPVNVPGSDRPSKIYEQTLAFEPLSEGYENIARIARDSVESIYSKNPDFIGLKTVSCLARSDAVAVDDRTTLWVTRKLAPMYASIMAEPWDTDHPSALKSPLPYKLGAVASEIVKVQPPDAGCHILRWLIHSYACVSLGDAGFWIDDWDVGNTRERIAHRVRSILGPERVPLEQTLGCPPIGTVRERLGILGTESVPRFWSEDKKRHTGGSYRSQLTPIVDVLERYSKHDSIMRELVKYVQ